MTTTTHIASAVNNIFLQYSRKLKKIWKKCNPLSIFKTIKRLIKQKKTHESYNETYDSLKKVQNELHTTYIMLKNILFSLNAEKRRKIEFLPGDLYKTKNCRVAVFEYNKNVLPGGYRDTYQILFSTKNIREIKNIDDINKSDFLSLHFFRDDYRIPLQAWALYQSYFENKPIYFVESSFITSIQPVTTEQWPIEFRRLYSFLVDDLSFYFDGQQPSRVEYYLNSTAAHLNDEQQGRCRRLIRFIVDNQLTKYNFQPLKEPDFFNTRGANVLVVDQVADDASIIRGRANTDSFKRMLEAAIKENPGASIYIKTHPDTVTRAKKCYYSGVTTPEVTKLTEAVNPYSILKHMDKVYVCTSQLGLEALMAGKEVITFGQPVYAGWGLTDDRVPNPSRTNKLTIEDLFFALYIKFTVHIHPYTLSICPIEDYLLAMVKLRSEYFTYLEKRT